MSIRWPALFNLFGTRSIGRFFRRFERRDKIVTPHPKNADGDFYVEFGYCTACDVPFAEAPGMFQYDDTNHCFVKRQPTTPDEVSRMLSAVMCAELQCIRYRGKDPAIFERLSAIGAPDVCDHPPENGIPVAIRNHVTFRVSPSSGMDLSPADLIEEYKQYLTNNQSTWISYKFSATAIDGNSATFGINWFQDHYNEVTFVLVDSVHPTFLIRHPNDKFPGMSGSISKWLESDKNFGNIRWFTRKAWEMGGPWHKTPW